jgi:hypothetical protein
MITPCSGTIRNDKGSGSAWIFPARILRRPDEAVSGALHM